MCVCVCVCVCVCILCDTHTICVCIMPNDADMFQHGGRPTRSNMEAADACMPLGI